VEKAGNMCALVTLYTTLIRSIQGKDSEFTDWYIVNGKRGHGDPSKMEGNQMGNYVFISLTYH
jgi:hypothetical protein